MSERVAVYIDFDNVVISRYDDIHGKQAWRKDDPRQHGQSAGPKDPLDLKLAAARVDFSAIIDFAASFGSVSLSRAYADWSVPANASYKTELIERSLHLVQLFTASGVKNGADIRLAVDAVEDLMRHPEITHVVLVAGDSDFVPLAQSCKQLGRYVVGIGVAGSTSRALVSACNEFIDYAHLPGVTPSAPAAKKAGAAKKSPAKKATKTSVKESPETAATNLLVRAIRVGLQKSDDDWVHAAGVKSQMQRMDPAFTEKSLGFSSFRAFVESRGDQVMSKVADNGQLTVRLP
ncbi:NYN domain-containing protein [Leekyejoonella antrihumi]|uniref:NYN domain-containing protein n=1 Tax=Leekyejoonella antrihumi TaxID=1660198 RepID=A0A563DSG2_9MICO|nr:NYN domain-containing protein [Leekyejoonella antrihumi]TWP33198.1 NYN domain-containing protein [Leekyejoonella antrihumi]